MWRCLLRIQLNRGKKGSSAGERRSAQHSPEEGDGQARQEKG